MLAQEEKVRDGIVQKSLSFLESLLAEYHPRNLAVRFWDGTTWDTEPGVPGRFTLVLNHPGALKKMFWPPGELTLANAYIHNDFDIEGDFEGAFPLGDYLTERHWNLHDIRYLAGIFQIPSVQLLHSGRGAAHLNGRPHSKNRDRQAVTYHYDVSNDFYRLWLDRRMVYSCAYFGSPDDDLDTAQERKLDYICRKLRLQPGERLLDIGCGWGGLLIHAASRYGVQACGITLSKSQAELATDRIREAGLTDRCRLEIADYRDVEDREAYDKLVSVGMFEHVGASKLAEYFKRAWRILKKGGIFLNHGIAYGPNVQDQNQSQFIKKYVFPDGELLQLPETLKVSEEAGFEIRDVESLREHYVQTLRHWVRRLEANYERALRVTDEVTCRIWRLYMSGAAHYFYTGRLNVYQSLLVKANQGLSGLPLTRADLYC
jgi:cyclopropane-fatty-acyl-phospholipid synthase